MYREVELYDIKNRPTIVYADLYANANTLYNDLYICIEGNGMDVPQDVKDNLLRLAKIINKYFDKKG